MRPFELAANEFIWSVTHLVAAPMPRFGSVWLEAVCRVPNETSLRIVARIRSGLIGRGRARRAGVCAGLGEIGAGGGLRRTGDERHRGRRNGGCRQEHPAGCTGPGWNSVVLHDLNQEVIPAEVNALCLSLRFTL